MKTFTLSTIAVVLIAVGCSQGVASPDSSIRGELPRKDNTVVDLWSGAEEILLTLGCPVNLDTYTVSHGIDCDGITVIEVRSHDFDPVAVLLDGNGDLVALNDDWAGKANARIVVGEIPRGARLLVFSPDDTRGLYDVVVTEGTPDDLQEFNGRTDLLAGPVEGTIDEDTYDSIQDRILRESLSTDVVWLQNFATARLYPFHVGDESGLVSLLLQSYDFDTFLVLLEVKGGDYRFVEYSDDYSGSDSRIITELDQGDYLALVMTYSAGTGGDFTLTLEILDDDYLNVESIEAPESGEIYTGTIEPDRNYALGFWPGMEDSWEAPGFLSPFSPVAGFSFEVESMAIYEVNASGDVDVCLTLLRTLDDGTQELVASNDDYAGLGSDSRVVEPLSPGEYTVLISLYSSGGEAEVSFYWQEAETAVESLQPGRTVNVGTDYDTELHMFSLVVLPGRGYSVSAESSEIDPVITVILPDGTRLTDDDGGDGTNSLLYFSTGDDLIGECFLLLTKYSGGEGTISVELEETGNELRLP